MGAHRLCEMEYFYSLGRPEEYERLKVTALNLWEAPPFRLTGASRQSPPARVEKVDFFQITTQSHRGREMG